MQDTTRVINAVETWQTVIINENEQVIADQANQHTYIDGTGVAAVIIDTGVDAGHPDFDYDEGKTVSYKFDRATRTWVEAENSDTSSGHGTHCAGTVGGNGDAAAGAKKGVAPGATLRPWGNRNPKVPGATRKPRRARGLGPGTRTREAPTFVHFRS